MNLKLIRCQHLACKAWVCATIPSSNTLQYQCAEIKEDYPKHDITVSDEFRQAYHSFYVPLRSVRFSFDNQRILLSNPCS